MASGMPTSGLALLAWVSGLSLLGVATYWIHAGLTHPAINDISTDLANPPAFRNMPQAAPYPGEAFARKQREAYPDVEPLLVGVSPSRAWRIALDLVRARGWAVVAADEAALRIEATAQSRIFRFTDEIVLRIAEAPEGARIDMRSRSRVGRSDLGVNAKRIRALLSDIDTRLRSGEPAPG